MSVRKVCLQSLESSDTSYRALCEAKLAVSASGPRSRLFFNIHLSTTKYWKKSFFRYEQIFTI